ncbi:uncharacterized protein G2W53_029720 [Senna tora]|uniref:Uncharacterized protein n=1 Tax=Senna tora TaxID=362788 RepID=A0A834WDY8_9FABA|nr:uncharacterized protein G2W53_029720 [Senna tora]
MMTVVETCEVHTSALYRIRTSEDPFSGIRRDTRVNVNTHLQVPVKGEGEGRKGGEGIVGVPGSMIGVGHMGVIHNSHLMVLMGLGYDSFHSLLHVMGIHERVKSFHEMEDYYYYHFHNDIYLWEEIQHVGQENSSFSGLEWWRIELGLQGSGRAMLREE